MKTPPQAPPETPPLSPSKILPNEATASHAAEPERAIPFGRTAVATQPYHSIQLLMGGLAFAALTPLVLGNNTIKGMNKGAASFSRTIEELKESTNSGECVSVQTPESAASDLMLAENPNAPYAAVDIRYVCAEDSNPSMRFQLQRVDGINRRIALTREAPCPAEHTQRARTLKKYEVLTGADGVISAITLEMCDDFLAECKGLSASNPASNRDLAQLNCTTAGDPLAINMQLSFDGQHFYWPTTSGAPNWR